MKVINRSAETISYDLPELHIKRHFELNEEKDIPEEELKALWQTLGGNYQIKNLLLVEDKEWVKDHWDAPIEYFWHAEDVKNCVLHDEPELFEETLDYAPEGVVEMIKEYAWRLPMQDLNKVEILERKTGFNSHLAAQIMKPADESAEQPTTTKQGRLRREEL